MENKTEYAYVGAVLSDTHAGAFEPKQWFMELEEGFLKFIEKQPILDFVILSGDFFDAKISMNSEHAKYALRFLTDLLRICSKRKTKLRIIKGTESHDNKQLEIFDFLYRHIECDFKVIHTVEKEKLFDDMHVLYIPEEYMPDKEAYYADYFNDTYDMIIGHGLVDKAVFVAASQESEVTMSKAPVFKTDELHAICKGPIYFGHVHKRMIVDRFRYVSSFSRWSFGEEEDKGFSMCYYAPETGQFKDEFVVNELARRFDTVKIEYGSPIFKKTEKDQVDYLIKLANTLTVDFLRFEINIPEEYPNPKLLTQLLMEAFSSYKNVKLKINNNSVLRQKKETEDKINALLERYEFIFDKGIEPEEKVSKFIKIHFGKNISVEKLRGYLYKGITKGEFNR